VVRQAQQAPTVQRAAIHLSRVSLPLLVAAVAAVEIR